MHQCNRWAVVRHRSSALRHALRSARAWAAVSGAHGAFRMAAAALFVMSVMSVTGCHGATEAAPRMRSETPPVLIDDGFTERSLGLDADLLEDKAGTLTLDAVRSPEHAAQFAASSTKVPSFGYTHSAWWARFSLNDERRLPGTEGGAGGLALTLAHPLTDLAELWCENARGVLLVHARAGDHVPFAEWPSSYREPTFFLPSGVHTCFLRVETGSSLQIPLTLRTREAFTSHRLGDTALQCLYFGALLVMAAYNGLVALATRSSAYGFYTAFLLSFGLCQCFLGGFGYAFFWPEVPFWVDRAPPLFIAATGLTSLLFTVALLALARTAPRLMGLIRVSVALFTVGAGAIWFLPVGLATRTTLAAVPLWAFAMLAAGLLQASRGVRVAKLYLAAWTVFIIATVVNGMRAAGLLPSNAVTASAQQLGSAIEFVLLSFALADRIKTLQAEVVQQAEVARLASEHALAEERRIGEERSTFVANTSHELRTPLNGMMGLVQAVMAREGEKLSEASQRSLDGVVRSGHRLAALVGDLLDLSRAEKGGIPVRCVPTSLAREAELVTELLAPAIEGKSLRLEVRIAPSLAAVHADPHRLQQILFNLLGNAIKFTDEGTISVTAQETGACVTVRIKDTGPGIAEAAQTRIFEAFQQADDGIARRFGGTGLGLAITRQLVEAQGGTVGVISRLGFGATFWFTLPRSLEAHTEEGSGMLGSVVADRGQILSDQIAAAGSLLQTEPAVDDPVVHTYDSHRTSVVQRRILDVLVVDDEPINRQVLAELLALGGHRVTLAANGLEGLARVRSQKPDLVLLDVMMPGKSGYDVLTELRRTFDELALPVLLLTAKAQESDLVRGFRSGATDYILKPFSAAEVLARVGHQARLREVIHRELTVREEGEMLRVTLLEAEEKLLHAERLASLGAVTAGVAHDLGNPLHHLATTFAWIAQRGATIGGIIGHGAPGRAELDAILELSGLGERSSRSALAIAEALRMASRTDDGVFELVRLSDAVSDALVILGHKLRPFEVSQTCDDAVVLRCRRSEALQVVMNLISNAADASSDAKGNAIHVSIGREAGLVIVSVHDTGPGVPEDLRAKIIQPFFTTKPSGRGTGLGLSTVVTIAKRWNADLQITASDRLSGAHFQVRIQESP